jgi:hypothetical protein
MDKSILMWSPLGAVSMLRDKYIISVIGDDGFLNKPKLEEMVREIANAGANAMRDFFWLDSLSAHDKLSPFWYSKTRQETIYNDRFFEIQRHIASICNKYNLTYYYDLFDHCGTKKATGNFNTWRFFEDYFYGDDVTREREVYIDKCLSAFSGLDVGFQLINEPKPGSGKVLAHIFTYLYESGLKDDMERLRKIIIGIDYALKEKFQEYSKDYLTFRNTIAQRHGERWKEELKSVCLSPVHNANAETLTELWGTNVGPGGTRRIIYSFDGIQNPRPTGKQAYEIAKNVYETKITAAHKDRVHFEVVYGKTKSEQRSQFGGVAMAYQEFFGEWPENYGKFEKKIIIPVSPGKIKNEKLVDIVYLSMLGRTADKIGKESYVDYLVNGGDVFGLCSKISESEEFDRYFLKLFSSGKIELMAMDFYLNILDREPDETGLTHTVEMIKNGMAAERCAAMINSDEFQKVSSVL